MRLQTMATGMRSMFSYSNEEKNLQYTLQTPAVNYNCNTTGMIQ